MTLRVLFLASIITSGMGCGGFTSDGVAAIRGAVVIGVPRLGAVGTRGGGYADGDLFQPRGIEAFSDGSCVVIDRSGRVQLFADDRSVRRTWFLPEWRDGQPVDVTLTPWDTLLVADTHYGRLVEYDAEGRELRRLPVGEPGIDLVRGVAVGPGETIYVTVYSDEDRVQRLDRQGHDLGSFGRRGDGPGEFMRPEGLAVGAEGDVFVVDCGHHRVLRFTAAGAYRAEFGSEGSGPGQFLYPFDIAVGSDDTLYVVDFQGNRIQRFTPEGEILGAAGGAGREAGRFATPRGIAIQRRTGGDRVFVADTQNHRVQRFTWKYDR